MEYPGRNIGFFTERSLAASIKRIFVGVLGVGFLLALTTKPNPEFLSDQLHQLPPKSPLKWRTWTGIPRHSVFSVSIESNENNEQQFIVDNTGQTLWSLIEAIGIPLTLAFLGFGFQQQQEKRAAENASEDKLQEYFDRISTVLLEHNLLAIAAKPGAKISIYTSSTEADKSARTVTLAEKELLNAASDIVEARTLSILRKFERDTARKVSIIRFLIDSQILPKLEVSLSKAKLSRMNLSYTSLSEVNLLGTNFRESDLKSTDLEGVNLNSADLRETDLRVANLKNANLQRAKLKGANFRGADLRKSDLRETDFKFADFRGANLRKAILDSTQFNGVDLSFTNLSFTDLRGRSLSKRPPIRPVNDFKCGANFSKASLRGANLTGANLREANLTGADLRETDLRRANLIGVNLSNADLRRANLSGANLSKANLSNTNLASANLRKANLSKANLSGAKLNSDRSGKISVGLLNISSTFLLGTFFDSEKDNISAKSLKSHNLFFKKVERIDLIVFLTNFFDIINNAYIRLFGRFSKPSQRELYSIELTDLSDADLSDADLSDADLSDADLSDADLSDADLSDTRITRAVLLATNLSSAKNLTSQQLNLGQNFYNVNVEKIDPNKSRPYLCNTALPSTIIGIDRNRNLGVILELLVEKYGYSAEEAEQILEDACQKQWS